MFDLDWFSLMHAIETIGLLDIILFTRGRRHAEKLFTPKNQMLTER